MTIEQAIDVGALPWVLDDADWRLYAKDRLPNTFDGWCRMWWGIAWVRLQAFERAADAEADAADAVWE